MANDIVVKFRVEQDGSLGQVEAAVGRLADSTDKAGDSAKRHGDQTEKNTGAQQKNTKETKKSTQASDGFMRKQKGVAGATSNSTKAFSKMQQGSSGLVSVYATLMANVFALSQAFLFLRDAADVQILQNTQVSFAQNTGVALGKLTQDLREASGGMLGFRDAAQASAMGIAKGFSPEQLQDLAIGARKASAALGRGFEDAFDRLIRGASKAEPELLDELGITLKLAEATEKYGLMIGKNAKDLTTYERSQAVLLETQRQLDEQFGSVDLQENAFIKLGKTFDDLVKTIMKHLMPAFNAFANFIADNAGTAVLVFSAIGMSILRTIPGFGMARTAVVSYIASLNPIPIIGEKILNMAASVTKTKAAFLDFTNKTQAEFSALNQEFKDAKTSLQELQAQARKDIGGMRSSIPDQGGKTKSGRQRGSAIMQRIKDGGDVLKKDLAFINRALDKIPKDAKDDFELTSGMFKGMTVKMARDFGKSANQIHNDNDAMGLAVRNQFKRIGIVGKATATGLKVGFLGTFKAITTSAKLAGAAVSAAMRFTVVLAVIGSIGQMFEKIVQSPYTLVKNIISFITTFARGLQFLMNMAAKGINHLFGTQIEFKFADGLEERLEQLAEKHIDMDQLFISEQFEKRVESIKTKTDTLVQSFAQNRDEMESIGRSIRANTDELDRSLDIANAMSTLGVASSVRKINQLSNIEDELNRASDFYRAHLQDYEETLASLSGVEAQSYRERFLNAKMLVENADRVRSVAARADNDALRAIKLNYKSLADIDKIASDKLQALNITNLKETADFLEKREELQRSFLSSKKAMDDLIKETPAIFKSGDILKIEEHLLSIEIARNEHIKFAQATGNSEKAVDKFNDQLKDFGGIVKLRKEVKEARHELFALAVATKQLNQLQMLTSSRTNLVLADAKKRTDLAKSRVKQERLLLQLTEAIRAVAIAERAGDIETALAANRKALALRDQLDNQYLITHELEKQNDLAHQFGMTLANSLEQNIQGGISALLKGEKNLKEALLDGAKNITEAMIDKYSETVTTEIMKGLEETSFGKALGLDKKDPQEILLEKQKQMNETHLANLNTRANKTFAKQEDFLAEEDRLLGYRVKEIKDSQTQLIDGLNTTAETIKNGMVSAADYHANAIKQALATQGVRGDQGFSNAEKLKAVHEGTLDPTKAKMNDAALKRHQDATAEAIEYLGTEAEYIKRLIEQRKGGLVEFTQKYAEDNKQIKKSGRMKAKGTNESTADFLDRAREAFIASVPAYKTELRDLITELTEERRLADLSTESVEQPSAGGLATAITTNTLGESTEIGSSAIPGALDVNVAGVGGEPQIPTTETGGFNSLRSGDGPTEIPGGAEATSPTTEAIEKNTEVLQKNALNTAKNAVAGLATVAALTGNQKVAEKLSLVMTALQLIQMAKNAFDYFIKPVEIATTTANAAATTTLATVSIPALIIALKANTAAQGATFFAKTGGIFSNGSRVKSYSEGGVAKGRESGYPAMLHGTEAVVPLPNNRSIPVDLKGMGGAGDTNNISINITSNSEGDSQEVESNNEQMALAITTAVQRELQNQKRAGGILSPYGAA